MVREHKWPVVLLPGGILPVGPAYAALLAEFRPAAPDRARESGRRPPRALDAGGAESRERRWLLRLTGARTASQSRCQRL